VFWPLQLHSGFSGVSEGSQIPISRVWVSSSHSFKMGMLSKKRKTILGSNFKANLYIHTFSRVFKGKNLFVISNTKSLKNNFWISFCFLKDVLLSKNEKIAPSVILECFLETISTYTHNTGKKMDQNIIEICPQWNKNKTFSSFASRSFISILTWTCGITLQILSSNPVVNGVNYISPMMTLNNKL
jgi:hypothetical protein